MAVAIAYVMQKTPYVFPIIGGRKVEHLHANIEALELALSKEHIKEIEGVVPFDLGFPYDFFVSCPPSSPALHQLTHFKLRRVARRTKLISSTRSAATPFVGHCARQLSQRRIEHRKRKMCTRVAWFGSGVPSVLRRSKLY